MSDLDWILDKMPRGEDLPIACTYEFSKGKPGPEQEDVPEGWQIVGDVTPEDVAAAGWPQMAHLQEAVLSMGKTFIYLKNAEDEIVATWDEGRWWTPDESASFTLMGLAPATYAMAEQQRISNLPRAMRRKLGYK